jgi:hypothetical protein
MQVTKVTTPILAQKKPGCDFAAPQHGCDRKTYILTDY